VGGSGGAAGSPSGGSPSLGGGGIDPGGAPSAGTSTGGHTAGAIGQTGGLSGTGGLGGSSPSAGTGTAGSSGRGGATNDGGTANGGGSAQGGAGSGGAAGAAGASKGGSGGSAGGTAKFHVFLLLGQSNMAGYAKAQAQDKMLDERIKVLGFDDCSATGRKANQWDIAEPPLHECFAGALGPADYFAKTLIQKLPAGDTIGLVPCALSGQAVEVFSKGGEKYDWVLQRAKNAKDMGGIIQGMLFHQGESNCGNPQWPMRVKKLVDDLKADLGLGDIPFLAGELPYESACGNHNPLVNQLPGLIPTARVVSAQGLALAPGDTSRFHFSREAQVEFGKRYEAAMVTALGW